MQIGSNLQSLASAGASAPRLAASAPPGGPAPAVNDHDSDDARAAATVQTQGSQQAVQAAQTAATGRGGLLNVIG